MKGQPHAGRAVSGVAEVGSRHMSLRQATIHFSFAGDVLHGHVSVEGRSPLAFSGIGELQRCLGVSQGHLALVNGAAEADREDTPTAATLTVTERRIIEAAVRGGSNREIAETTFYSVKSVEAYLTRIYRRFGISGRTELARVLDLAPPADDAEPVVGDAPGGAPWTTPPPMHLLAV